MPLNENLAAVIVTFNRSEKLMNVLDALQGQTRAPDVVFVVDNASTDDTQERVSERADTMPSLRYIRLPENVGGAGGFNEGIKAAYQDGATHIWVSDDDAYPEPDCIEHLLHALTEFEHRYRRRPAFACSRVEWVDGNLCEMNTPRTVWDWPRFVHPDSSWAMVDSASFVSILLPRWAVADHGLPISDYFIWFDDAEYTRRISKSHPGIFVPESRAVHDTPVNQGVNYGLVTEQNVWKYRYGARNETSYRLREHGAPGVASFALSIHRQMAGSGVSWELRREVFKAMADGMSFHPPIEGV